MQSSLAVRVSWYLYLLTVLERSADQQISRTSLTNCTSTRCSMRDTISYSVCGRPSSAASFSVAPRAPPPATPTCADLNLISLVFIVGHCQHFLFLSFFPFFLLPCLPRRFILSLLLKARSELKDYRLHLSALRCNSKIAEQNSSRNSCIKEFYWYLTTNSSFS